MASNDTNQNDWNKDGKQTDEESKTADAGGLVLDYTTMPEEMQQLFDQLNECIDKMNIIYDQCITEFNIKDNPYKGGK